MINIDFHVNKLFENELEKSYKYLRKLDFDIFNSNIGERLPHHLLTKFRISILDEHLSNNVEQCSLKWTI